MKRNMAKFLFLAPSFLGVVIFVLLPFGDVVKRSFMTAVTKEGAGMRNYQTIFTNSAFLLAVKNTFRFTLVCIPLLVAMGLAIALAMGSIRHMQAVKSLYLFPLAMPTATVAVVWKMLFYEKGFFNKYLEQICLLFHMGEGMETLDYISSGAAFYVLAGTYLWKNLGYTIVLWLAGIMGINKDMLEAAGVDGANKMQRVWYVLLPNLKGSLYIIVVISFLNSFKIYREAYLVAGAYPHDSIYMLQHLFNNWFVNLDLDKMAAAAVVCALFFLIFILLLQGLWDKETG
ncbi:MAG: sugar ABC transporter permease [Lachnospiraceae bacterium]|nr:sugar ABC transporter permease [Lachnospiraceae bacterium]